MSNANDVLNTIKDEMVDYIKSSRSPYRSDIAQFIRGAHTLSKSVNKPYIGIHMLEDDTHIVMQGGNNINIVTAELYCYMNPEAVGVYDTLHHTRDDIVYFLTNDCSHRSYVVIGKYIPYEGGVSSTTINFFRQHFTVKYEYSPI